MEVEVELKAGERAFEGALALVVGEHVDKLALLEPGVKVLEKEIVPAAVRFRLEIAAEVAKPLEEILRGYRIGCWRIAREYRLVKPGDPPLFKDGSAGAGTG